MSMEWQKSSDQKNQSQQDQRQQESKFVMRPPVPPNKFFNLHGDSPPPPGRLYARIDSVEVDSDGGRMALLDSVGADWFDDRPPQDEPIRGDDSRRMPVAVLEAQVDMRSGHDDGKELIGEEDWVEAHVEFAGGPDRIYGNFFGNARDVTITFRRIDVALMTRLEKSFSLDDVPATSVETLGKLVPPTARLINVLDVGQGNAVSIWDERGSPTLYFDLGGGVLGNVKTFPRAHVGFCATAETTIILSHWDWDHWSSALRYPDVALNLNWIVPRQKLGAIHRAFAAQLLQRNHLHVWPDDVKQLEQGQIRIVRCLGKDQNNSGLAMIVASARKFGRRVALLPGDAEYSSIPKIRRPQLVSSLVASHHGARLASVKQVRAPRTGGALVYSYGHGNAYGHPRLHAQLDYLVAGWKPEHTYSTTQSSRQRPCNIGIWCGRAEMDPTCPACKPKVLSRL